MGNAEHVNWLLEGVESWNARRRESNFKPNLEDVDIPRAFREAGIIENSHSSTVRLDGIDLSGARLKNASFEWASLKEAKFTYADLGGSDFSFADLTDANLISATVTEAKLYHATLTYANLSNTEFWNSILYEPANEATPVLQSDEDVLKARIDSVAELLDVCKKLEQHYSKFRGDDVVLYYRGESSDSWNLEPSVMRGAYSSHESEMLVDLISRQPESFRSCDSAFSQWVLGQHHGMKSRLFDITRNPLVGLYFSCDSTERRNQVGVLHAFAVPKAIVKPFNSDTVSVVMNFAKLSSLEQEILSGERVFYHALDYGWAINRLYQLIRQESPSFQERIDPADLFRVLVVEPQRAFDRIRAQSGAFLVSAFHRRFEPEDILKWNEGIPVYNHYAMPVGSECKESILKELRVLNITRETLFPGLEESAKAVTEGVGDATGP